MKYSLVLPQGKSITPQDAVKYFSLIHKFFNNTVNRKAILIPLSRSLHLQKRQMKFGAGAGHSDSAIPLNLQVWMTASVCAAKVRHVSLSDEWVCSFWKNKIKQNHLTPVKAVLQTLLVGPLTSLCVIHLSVCTLVGIKRVLQRWYCTLYKLN